MTDVSSHVSAPPLDGHGRRELARRLRVAQAAVDDRFITPWSSRAFGSEALPAGALEVLFKAARWAELLEREQPSARRALSEVALRGRYSSSAPVISPALPLATANVG